jgi:hypothetical protein
VQRNYASCGSTGGGGGGRGGGGGFGPAPDQCHTPVQTPRFPKRGRGAASFAAASTVWDGRAVYNWSMSPGSDAESALAATIDLGTTPSLAGKAVYFAMHGAPIGWDSW